jgi:hypothetical protein
VKPDLARYPQAHLRHGLIHNGNTNRNHKLQLEGIELLHPEFSAKTIRQELVQPQGLIITVAGVDQGLVLGLGEILQVQCRVILVLVPVKLLHPLAVRFLVNEQVFSAIGRLNAE